MNHFDFLPLLRYLLERLVRLALGCGISYQAFSKLLRSVYFDMAKDYEPVKGKPNSDSRISLLTGLPRRDVRALRAAATQPPAPVPSIERLVMDAWTAHLEFLDDDGRMRPLARTVRKGGARSFEALVERVSTDIRARALLDEWLRKGHVVLDDEDRVVVVPTRRSQGVEDTQGASLLVGEIAADLLDGFEIAYLKSRPVPGYAFNLTYGHGLTEESVQLICSTAMREGADLTARMNRMIVEREARDADKPGAQHRVSIAFMSYPAHEGLSPGLLAPARAMPTPSTPASF